jgi:hypothetical protein
LAFIAHCSAWMWRWPLAFSSATASSAASGWCSSTSSSVTVIRRAVLSDLSCTTPASQASRRAGFAHAVRGAGADQGGQAGVLRQLGGAHGGLFGMAEAAFEQGFQGVAQALVAFALALAQAVGGHPLRHAEGGAHRAQQPYSTRNSSAASTTNRFSDRSIRCGG